MKPKILLYDLETFPNLGWIWGKYEQNVIDYEKESCLATIAWKWLGEKKVYAKSLPDYKGYKAGSFDDKELVKELWKLFDEADVIIAHNGDRFDVRKANARFVFHKLTPPSPYKSVDTKKVAKNVGMFNSNKLDDLGELLSEGRKIKTDFSLWKGCMNGDQKSWDKMVKYNKQDVLLLERIYLRFLPYIKNHPVLEHRVCPNCRGSHIQKRGVDLTRTSRFERLKCMDCGAWFKGKTIKEKV